MQGEKSSTNLPCVDAAIVSVHLDMMLTKSAIIVTGHVSPVSVGTCRRGGNLSSVETLSVEESDLLTLAIS